MTSTTSIMILVRNWAFSLLILSCFLDVAFAGNIIEGPINTTVELNRVAILKCYVNKTTGDEVHWFIDGQLLFVERTIQQFAISPNDESRFSVRGSSDYEYHLEIRRVTLSDARLYTCKLQSSSAGSKSVEQSGYLTIHRAPSQIYPDCMANGINSAPYTFEAGTEVTFECKCKRAIPDVTLKWMADDGDNGVEYRESLLDDSSAVEVKRYFRLNLTIEDHGRVFSCESGYSSSILGNHTGLCNIGPLEILHPPKSIGIISHEYAVMGLPYLITCNATRGNPHTSTFEWTLDPDIPKDRLYESLNVLGIRSIVKSDNEVNVTCSATNGVGDAINSESITLCVVPPPPALGPTEPTAPSDGDTVIVPFNIVYILIILLAGLVFLLLLVWIVLYILIRRRRRNKESWVSDDDGGGGIILRSRLPSWMQDDLSVKSYRSDPGVAVYLPDLEFDHLKAGSSHDMGPGIESADNPESPRYFDHRFSNPYMRYIPNAVAIDAMSDTSSGYSPVVLPRQHSFRDDRRRPAQRLTRVPLSRRQTVATTDESSRRLGVKKTHTWLDGYNDNVENSQIPTTGGESHAPDSVEIHQRKQGSPAIRYKKHTRQSSGGGVPGLQVSLTTPSNSPRASPSSSPYRNGKHRVSFYRNRSLPDPMHDDATTSQNGDFEGPNGEPTEGSSRENSATNPDTLAPNSSSFRFRLYSDESGVMEDDEEGNHGNDDDDDVFVVVDSNRKKGNDSEQNEVP